MREKRGTYLFSEQYNAVRFLLLGRKEDLRKEYNTPLILSIIHIFYTPENHAKSNFNKLSEKYCKEKRLTSLWECISWTTKAEISPISPTSLYTLHPFLTRKIRNTIRNCADFLIVSASTIRMSANTSIVLAEAIRKTMKR